MDPTGWTVADHTRGKPDAAVALYERFVELVAACGPFTFSPSRTTITFKGERRGFAGARPTDKGRLDGYLDLQREVTDPRILRASPYTRRLFVHHFRVDRLEQLDEEFAAWVAAAYAVGRGDHLGR